MRSDPADLLLGQDAKTLPSPCRRHHQGGQGGRRSRPRAGNSEEAVKLETLEKAGKLKRVAFEERDPMKKLADPVMAAYAKEIGAEGIYEKINVA